MQNKFSLVGLTACQYENGYNPPPPPLGRKGITCEAASNAWTSGTILSTAEGAWRKIIVGDNR